MGVDAAGEIITGALLGRAVEPHAGENRGDVGHGEGGLCLNCGTALVGPHCHRCGQSAHIHRSFGAIWHEILHGVVHFEGKLWSTLPLLAWRPGELTRRYVHGERARFVSPMALFLFSIFTMFAMFQIMGISPPSDINIGGKGELAVGLEEGHKRLEKDLAQAQKNRAKVPDGTKEAAALDKQVADAREALATLEKTESVLKPTLSTSKTSIHTGWERLDHGLEKAQKHPELMLYKLQSNSYKFSWLLIPLSLPFMWLMFFWKRDYKMYDHAVFVTYSLAFMSLLFIVLTLAGAVGVSNTWLGLVGTAVPVIHLYRQLRGAYQLRRRTAILRTFFLLMCIVIILTLFLVLVIGLGLVG
ncbi:DUF3667 domain-containing protein [Sphingomonas cannabina]|uniref:DUF3667 domain-containing protein n=1 Tax=Sphingomonas cannabina TaxID=2899123 RepID=UPI001F3B90E1|nr:DUF3667 domain-containing protein [Sphingomonas cannabina]UIJ45362.1 DUF3667 domain-containing protein [Sphingomonas cannabina]